MDIQSFIAEYDVEYSNNLIKAEDLTEVTKTMGVKLGRELTDYILKYGYLAFKHSELYGINSRQFLDSDLVTQTIYLHKYYPETKEFIAIENQGEGDYYLVDEKDNIYEFDTELRELTPTLNKLYEFIMQRFESII